MPLRPPLQSEIEPSTSGIIMDPQTGDRIVAASKRPDGTLRKEIRIRPGYTPQEDVSKFRSARQQDSERTALPKGSVVGFIRPEQAAAQVALQNMTTAQRKNAKRKAKRKDNDAVGMNATSPSETPDEWDAEDNTEPNKSFDDHQAGNFFSQRATKPSSKTEVLSELELPEPVNEPKHLGEASTQREIRSSCETPGAGAQLFGNALFDIKSHGATTEKRSRALRKKLIQAEQLQSKQDRGEILLPEQVQKVNQVEALRSELANLQLSLNT